MEIDWIRSSSKTFIQDLLIKYPMDVLVGSVHHVHSIPIDYSKEMYEQALTTCDGSTERLYEAYFDAQYDMLRALKPPIVGHFDLIRLYSNFPDASLKTFPTVWSKISRNVAFVVDYQGIFEINSAALRKGLQEPYPSVEVCQVR